jgi:PEP-CTERM motif
MTEDASIVDKAYRLGALAIAAGSSALWAGAAQATLVTQTFNLNFNPGGNVQIGNGSPFGSPQYSTSQVNDGDVTADYIMLYGTAAIVGTASTGVCGPVCDAKATDLAPGTTIGPSTSSFIGVSDTQSGGGGVKVNADLKPEYTPFTGYLGLRFDIDSGDEVTSDPYGYATIVDDTLVSITYDDSGASVTIPVSTPEPASLGLLAFGAAGVAAIRKRRRQTIA